MKNYRDRCNLYTVIQLTTTLVSILVHSYNVMIFCCYYFSYNLIKFDASDNLCTHVYLLAYTGIVVKRNGGISFTQTQEAYMSGEAELSCYYSHSILLS